jgi:uncharacterized protein YlxW (UPF0749 family)
MTDERHDEPERPIEPPAEAVPTREVKSSDAVDDATAVDREAAADGAIADSGGSDGTDDAERQDDAATPTGHDAEPEHAPESSTAAVADSEAAAVAGPDSDGVGDPESAAVGGPNGADAAVGGSGSSWRLTAAVRTPKLTAANLIIALLIGLLGFALIAQVHSNSNESTLANDRPDDLVRILSDLDARRDRLSTEISSLQATVRQLNSGAQSRQAALDAAAKRANELGILGGTLPATGPGLVIDLIPASKQQISADRVLDTVEELRGAGAEAMQINGTGSSAVRIVASTYFTDATGGIDVDGQIIGGTLTVTAIGDPQTMQAALSIAGGVVDSVRNDGGTVQVNTPGTVQVTALHAAQPLRFATPVS